MAPSHGSHDEVTERSDLSLSPRAISSLLTSDHAPWPTLHMVQWCMEPGLCHFPGNADKCKFLLTAGLEDCHQESYTNFHSFRKVSSGFGQGREIHCFKPQTQYGKEHKNGSKRDFKQGYKFSHNALFKK